MINLDVTRSVFSGFSPSITRQSPNISELKYIENGGKAAPILTDVKRVEKIISQIPSFINAKKPLDCILGILKTMKIALGKSYQKLTIFIVDKTLQNLIFKGTERMKKHYRSMPLETNMIVAVYLSEDEYGAP